MALEQSNHFDFKADLKGFALAFDDIIQELKMEQKKMLITTHRYLDGDAFGSAVALGLILSKRHIDSTLVLVPFIPYKFKFLAVESKLQILDLETLADTKREGRAFPTQALRDYFIDKIKDYGALTILDCAGFGQIPEEVWTMGRRLPHIINIDHHAGYKLDSCEYRILNLVGNCSSTSEVLFHLMEQLGMDVAPEIAVPLYMGIKADLRKNDILKESSSYPKRALSILNSQVKKMGKEMQDQIKDIFSLDPWEKYLLKTIIDTMGLVENIAHVRFDPHMVFRAKQATDSLDNKRMPFHEVHVQLRQWLRRYRKESQIAIIFDQILGKVSLYDLHKKGIFDLARISRELANGGGHSNRAGFSFKAAKERLMNSDMNEADLSDDMVMDKIVEFIRRQVSETADAKSSMGMKG